MLKIELSTDNAAFSNGEAGYEIARILRDLADLAENNQLAERNIRDINGNRIGKCVCKEW